MASSTAVDDFELELNSLSSTKLPISASKIQSVTKAAFRAVKHYKEVVHAIEKYLQSCPAQYKLPAIYVVDSVSRVCASASKGGGDKYKEAMHQRIEQRLRGLFGMAALCTGKDRERLKRLLDVWEKNSVFAVEALAPLPALLENLAPVDDQTHADAKSASGGGRSSGKSSRDKKAATTVAAAKESPKPVVQVEPPKVDVNNVRAQAMMQSLFAMMTPANGGAHAAAANAHSQPSDDTQKAAKAAATISNLLGQDASTGGKVVNAVFDYDDEGSASSSSDVEEDADKGTSSKTATDKKDQTSAVSAAADTGVATITPEEQMRSLLTAVQAVIPSTSQQSHHPQLAPPPLINNAAVGAQQLMATLSRVDSTGSLHSTGSSIAPGQTPLPLNPSMLMNPAMMMMPGMFPPPPPGGVLPPPAHMIMPGGIPAAGQPPIPVPGMPMPMPMIPAQMLTAEDYNSAGRIRRIEPGIPQDSIRILSRTLYMGGLNEGVTTQQLEDVFRSHNPESVTYNPSTHSSFVKMKSRAIAEQAKAQHNGEVVAGLPIKIHWACGFGPKDIFDRTRGFSTIADHDLKEADRRWLALEIGHEFLRRHSTIVLKRENLSERDFWFGGVLCEEPDTTGKKAPPEKRGRDGNDRSSDARDSRRRRE